ncbi:hypothetical protein CXG81DRAFT_11788 [Caulochytrium protostelioides]|uniref:Methyltransferase domain-containing protein n=1 Tax=Caulochytrium protostelioides TaxID=1555241 RepID=A0A4V1IUS7_9FUNG|nr:hypothetical protein CXG81DRAFT_11788 [Caulochytrium protostelioides]|eukprot:RKP01599.1 hypothetical protein CXG81DRAFT_11788 [Caulochytrium protostelioides]
MQQLAGRRATLLALDGDDQRTPDERLADQVTPLWRKPYDMQLQKKQTEVMHVMRDLTGALGLHRGRRQLRYLEGAMVAYAGAPCPVGTIVPAPQPNGYRNKCEFTFGVDVNGELTVGFLCGLFKEGHTAVLGPDACLHVSDAAKHVARALQAYARDSGLPAYDRHTKTGFWRLAVVRTNETGEIQVIVQANGGATTASRLAAVTEGLVPFWAETAATIHRAAAAGAGADTDTDAPASTPAPATSLLFQDWRGDFNGFPGTVSAPVTVLSGLPYITERLLGLDFRISPGAFFQVNTPATIGLYTYLREAVLAAFAAAAPSDASAPRPPSLVLDLCCGTGTIGLAIAPAVTHVIGVEMVPAAVDDAKANAAAQGQTNIEFICSKVEDAMDQVVARGSAIITSIIYVACNAKAVVSSDWMTLCSPTSKKLSGRPFRPVRAQPFDLFPHTPHYELVVEFTR